MDVGSLNLTSDFRQTPGPVEKAPGRKAVSLGCRGAPDRFRGFPLRGRAGIKSEVPCPSGQYGKSSPRYSRRGALRRWILESLDYRNFLKRGHQSLPAALQTPPLHRRLLGKPPAPTRLKDICPMNFIRRWRYGAERHQEQLLVKLWTINTLDADDHTQSAQLTPKLALAAKHELK